MAPRTSWKGFLRLSLVSVPVRAFTANNTSEDVRLNQLHKGCNGRVRYKKVCAEHGELQTDDIVSGYEYAKDQYVVIDPTEVAKLRAVSDKTVRIDGFVKVDQIDPIYLAGKTQFLLPDGVAGSRPYALLRQGMVDAGVVGIGQVVLSGREQLTLVRPLGDLIVLNILHYAKKVKEIASFEEELEEQKSPTKAEVDLTKTLIAASILDDFDMASYKDRYVEDMNELIQLKVDGKEIVEVPDQEAPKIINLMEALKKSVAEAQAARKMAPSVKEPAEKKAAPKKARKKKTG